MSKKGDKTCPLCAEEMDFTDQQLKPCKCGYEICVWCWNHIMEIAEKDKTEGHCPACRTPYDKEKIVAMAANCERMVAEINSERKLKSQKVRPKTSGGRVHLSNVRVIQRNLAYIVGLPLNLADEALLQQREYFGQYGKVLKVSISRTAAGVIQHSANNICCVYITYSKEEEAVRCIKSVHSFVLAGRSLRAYFGTTKYCHAWLKNVPCSIPDCLYLHDFGSQEDSFAKDDLVSAFTRSRVEQITGATNNLNRRSGNVLPPPVDEYLCRNISSTAKIESRNSSNHNTNNCNEGSCADNVSGRSIALPGAESWVMRVSPSFPAQAVKNSSDSPWALNATQDFASEVVSFMRYSDAKGTISEGTEGSCEVHPVFIKPSSCFPCQPTSQDTTRDIALPPTITKPSSAPSPLEEENLHAVDSFEGLSSDLLSMDISCHLMDEYSNPVIPGNLASDHNILGCQGLQQDVSDLLSEPSASQSLRKSVSVEDFFCDLQLNGLENTHLLSSMPCLPLKQDLKQSNSLSRRQLKVNNQSSIDEYLGIIPTKSVDTSFPLTSGNPIFCSGIYDNLGKNSAGLCRSSSYSTVFSDMGIRKPFGEPNNSIASVSNKVATDTGENSIISSILSMDSDAWENSLVSPQSLTKLLIESDKTRNLEIPGLQKVNESSQSRFSFARQDELFNQACNLEHSLGNSTNKSSVSHCCVENKDHIPVKCHRIPSNGNSMESNGFLSSQTLTSSSFSVSNAQTSSPRGFSMPSKAVPLGFLTQETMQYAFDHPANESLLNSASPSRCVGSSWVDEDPPAMEVVEGMQGAKLNNPALSPVSSTFDQDMKLHMLMQQSIAGPQNPMFTGHFRNRFSSECEAYNVFPIPPSQLSPNNPSAFAQVPTQQIRNLNMSNGRGNGQNEVNSVSDLGMLELLTNRGQGLNKFIPSYEDLKYQIYGSKNLNNRGFAM